jgi:hypothetical protein
MGVLQCLITELPIALARAPYLLPASLIGVSHSQKWRKTAHGMSVQMALIAVVKSLHHLCFTL